MAVWSHGQSRVAADLAYSVTYRAAAAAVAACGAIQVLYLYFLPFLYLCRPEIRALNERTQCLRNDASKICRRQFFAVRISPSPINYRSCGAIYVYVCMSHVTFCCLTSLSLAKLQTSPHETIEKSLVNNLALELFLQRDGGGRD